MTNLEDLWNSFPVRRHATSDLVRAARLHQASRRRRLILRPIALGGVAALAATAFVVGQSTAPAPHLAEGVGARDAGSGRSGDGSIPAADASPVSFVPGLKAAASCEALLASYKKRAMSLVTPWGWESGMWGDMAVGGLATVNDLRRTTTLSQGYAGGAMASRSSAKADATSTSPTGTNVQEVGVDEPDLVKTDGRLMVRVKDARLDVFDVAGTTVQRTGTLKLGNLNGTSVLLSGSTAIVIGSEFRRTSRHKGTIETAMVSVSLADPAKPREVTRTRFSASEVTARQSGSTIRLVLTSTLPQFDFALPTKSRTKAQTRELNRSMVRASTLEDWLPTYDDGKGPRQLLECDEVALPEASLMPGTVAIVGFDAASPLDRSSVGIATTTDLTYQNDDHLYLAGTRTPWRFAGCAACSSVIDRAVGTANTSLFAFELDGIAARHIASGSVKGSLRDRWSIDATADTLRLALASARTDASEVVTMRIDRKRLTQIGRIGGLGKDESIQSVRWFDDLALLVTYREVDPLYAIDLTDPTKPREISHLKALGYSAYLHPLDAERVLGVGVRARGGAKATLFDVSDLAAMREASVTRFPRGSNAVVAWETRAFTWLPDQQVALTPLNTRRGGVDLAIIGVNGERLTQSTVALRTPPKGKENRTWWRNHYDASTVRTLGTADGRVVVATPNEVRFLPLP